MDKMQEDDKTKTTKKKTEVYCALTTQKALWKPIEQHRTNKTKELDRKRTVQEKQLTCNLRTCEKDH
jgi:hypothetical protein